MTDPSSTGGVIGLVGNGVVGQRIQQRIATVRPDARVVMIDTRRNDLATSPLLDGLDAVILAHPGPHHGDARRFIQRGVSVVSIGDQIDDVRALLDLDALATDHGVSMVVGAGMTAGLVGLLARHLTSALASIDEIHVSLHGTAGPECARQHHRALNGIATNLVDGVEVTARASTGRLLAWFPEPVGPYDCYRAAVPAPLLLRRAFPQAERVQARLSANRRDRLTSRLPMLTRPHREGGIGAVRVEVRGTDQSGARSTIIAGVAELVGTAAAATAVAFADATVGGSVDVGVTVPGEAGLDTRSLLHTIERLGVRLQEFTGVPSA